MIIEGWLSREECAIICTAARHGNLSICQVADDRGRLIDRGFRKSHEMELTPDVETILRPAITRLPKDIRGINLPLQYTQFRILHYTVGDLFRPHKDCGSGPDVPGHIRKRLLTVVCALNGPDEYLGGDFVLYRPFERSLLSIPHRLSVGSAFCFDSNILHEVRPITHGERFSLVGWGLAV